MKTAIIITDAMPATQQGLHYVRPQVVWFAIAMERQLKLHDQTKGESWKTLPAVELLNRLYEKAAELVDAACDEPGHSPIEAMAESADLANYAMMIAHAISRAVQPCPTESGVTQEETATHG